MTTYLRNAVPDAGYWPYSRSQSEHGRRPEPMTLIGLCKADDRVLVGPEEARWVVEYLRVAHGIEGIVLIEDYDGNLIDPATLPVPSRAARAA